MIGDIYSVKEHPGFLAIWSPAKSRFGRGSTIMQVVVEGAYTDGVVLPEGSVYPQSAATMPPSIYFVARSKENLVLVGKLDSRYRGFISCAANITTSTPTKFMSKLYREIIKMRWY